MNEPSRRFLPSAGLGFLFLFLFVAPVRGTEPASPEADPSPAAHPRMTLQAAQRVVAEVATEVERLRGLTFEHQVPVSVIDDAQARAHMIGRLERFDEIDKLAVEQRAYELLGLIEPGTDVFEAMLGAMEEQAGGFYDPGSRAYYLLDDVPAAAASIFTAHELTHAIEDQEYDLDARLERVIDDDDRLFALGAVHEGSATLLMSVYTAQALVTGKLEPSALQGLAELEMAQTAQLEALPAFLQRHLLGPYVLGLSFLTEGNLLAIAGGYPIEKVNRLYREPPTSSEQILHPEKYWNPEQRDEPQRVSFGRAGKTLGRGWKRAASGVLGELTLGLMVGAQTPGSGFDAGLVDGGDWTHEAAAGWGGDRWELWLKGGAAVVLLLTGWDTAEDAEEFVAALDTGAELQTRSDGRWAAVVAGGLGDRSEAVLDRLLRNARAKGD